MDLKQLEYFVAVAELGSFTRASALLQVTQPALSRQVRALETEFRQHLLTRNGRGVVPTDAGKQLLELGRGLLHQAQRLREELGHNRGALVGRVVVGLPPSLSRALAVPLTREFARRMPEAELSMGTALTRNLEESLTLGQLDVAILLGTTAHPSGGAKAAVALPGDVPRRSFSELELEPLADDPLQLVFSRRRRIQQVDRGTLNRHAANAQGALPLAALAELPLIIPRRPNAIRMRVEDELARAGFQPRIALEVDSISAILDLVDEGLGCAVLSSLALDLARSGSQLNTCAVGEPALTSTLMLATSTRRPLSKTVQEVMLILRELLQDGGANLTQGRRAARAP